MADPSELGSAVVVSNVRKTFGTVTALDGLSFSAAPGSVLGILGPNGAGKTTLIEILCTLSTPDSGNAIVCGFDVVSRGADVRERISMTGQYAALDETLSGRENLVFFARMVGLRRASARERARYLLDLFDLSAAGHRPVSTYSGGMRRRLDIACGLVARPEVVFLDEPTTGLDPRSRQRVWDLVESLKLDGITTILTTQYLDEADKLSDRIVVIDHGRVVAEGTPTELKARVGDTVCEAFPETLDDVERLAAAVSDEWGPDLQVTVHSGAVRLSAVAGVDTLADVLAVASRHGIRLQDARLRTPSLDDVFLALTSPSARPADTAGTV
ncbi:ATP-binding cassette domain-containing protein [Rhodococcus sp. BP-349]|uniref:ATP-binding cassette domain-containing protein n=1 Tax=unclassified Rhodococcus (in: high G+C Gram-positive bacteria) TaxID=192944 RepID=UPI001C9AC358|nr:MULTISPECIES: ATP-binding cassette domain-containing protein [unclassified Rhodococcus (in: high G+C Gram-positive bacteria)]MBY6538123.1 ATP-binding cassette domain-containing protein [Rhodococcus sp. BP-363]MBY6542460.1 ATP-binding cassette domain-containing protein [Rhodococcus sp. BP-369]MBY6561690.1 ATP-binding cassette domain-containing protein [Rhodococcus sp. BP-370]MBY6575982.1 ATP-binding cassette domain-containing protein [Rhodococcus sp. BP-364]MBY6585283.1 ATP-binding cassette 